MAPCEKEMRDLTARKCFQLLFIDKQMKYLLQLILLNLAFFFFFPVEKNLTKKASNYKTYISGNGVQRQKEQSVKLYIGTLMYPQVSMWRGWITLT